MDQRRKEEVALAILRYVIRKKRDVLVREILQDIGRKLPTIGIPDEEVMEFMVMEFMAVTVSELAD